jgi:hypothetical protein
MSKNPAVVISVESISFDSVETRNCYSAESSCSFSGIHHLQLINQGFVTSIGPPLATSVESIVLVTFE